MVGLRGAFPGSWIPQLGTGRARIRGRLLAAILALFWGAGLSAATIPGYARQALAAFDPNVPTGWAYTVTTESSDQQISERYDPSLPPDSRWALLTNRGRAPTPEEAATYARERNGGTATAPQASFRQSDIDPESLVLVHEDDRFGEFTANFSAVAVHGDRMLGHLNLRLTIARENPHVEKYTLELPLPYNPVLGVKMRELHVRATFTRASQDRPSLPAETSSTFIGRVFLFFPVEEKLRLTFSDFERRP